MHEVWGELQKAQITSDLELKIYIYKKKSLIEKDDIKLRFYGTKNVIEQIAQKKKKISFEQMSGQ